MALIEHLERDDWENFLRQSFAYTLEVLKNDRFRPVGSAVDDLRSWLVAGGIRGVQERLNYQMEMRRFPPVRQTAAQPVFLRTARGFVGWHSRFTFLPTSLLHNIE
jgi:hypothetical protein